MKHYKRRGWNSPITCYNAEHTIALYTSTWFTAVYVGYSSLHKQIHVIYLTGLFLEHQILWEASMVCLHILRISSDISLVVLSGLPSELEASQVYHSSGAREHRWATPTTHQRPPQTVTERVVTPPRRTFPPFSLLLPQIGLIAYCQFCKHERFLLGKPCLGEGLWRQCAWGIRTHHGWLERPQFGQTNWTIS